MFFIAIAIVMAVVNETYRINSEFMAFDNEQTEDFSSLFPNPRRVDIEQFNKKGGVILW